MPLAFYGMLGLVALRDAAASADRRFTVTDEIEMLSIRGTPEFSPDGSHFFVVTQRGLLAKNVPEYTVWVWTTDAVTRFLSGHATAAPKPIPLIRVASYKDGPVNGMHFEWLPDSSAVVYAGLTERGSFRLFRADLETRASQPLTTR